jgi:hypothetical protein
MQVVLMNQVTTQRGDDGASRIVPALGEQSADSWLQSVLPVCCVLSGAEVLQSYPAAWVQATAGRTRQPRA